MMHLYESADPGRNSNGGSWRIDVSFAAPLSTSKSTTFEP